MSWLHDEINRAGKYKELLALLRDCVYVLEDGDERAKRLAEHIKILLRNPV